MCLSMLASAPCLLATATCQHSSKTLTKNGFDIVNLNKQDPKHCNLIWETVRLTFHWVWTACGQNSISCFSVNKFCLNKVHAASVFTSHPSQDKIITQVMSLGMQTKDLQLPHDVITHNPGALVWCQGQLKLINHHWVFLDQRWLCNPWQLTTIVIQTSDIKWSVSHFDVTSTLQECLKVDPNEADWIRSSCEEILSSKTIADTFIFTLLLLLEPPYHSLLPHQWLDQVFLHSLCRPLDHKSNAQAETQTSSYLSKRYSGSIL